jgi:hypothetical protein
MLSVHSILGSFPPRSGRVSEEGQFAATE